MTVVAGYRQGDPSIFVVDLRVTWLEQAEAFQQDVLIKFLPVGRMGLFLAGDVSFRKQAGRCIAQVEPAISFGNLFEPSGPLNDAMNDIALTARECSHSAAVGFLIDKGIKEQFVLDVCPGQGCVTRRLGDCQCTLLGNGANIAGLKETITSAVGPLMRDASYDLPTLGNVMRQLIKTHVENEGKFAYTIYGNYPVMATAWLASSDYRAITDYVWGLEDDKTRNISGLKDSLSFCKREVA